MWITINHERINTDDIKRVKDGIARVFAYSARDHWGQPTDYYATSENGITVTMKDATIYHSIDDAANRNRREFRRAGVIEP